MSKSSGLPILSALVVVVGGILLLVLLNPAKNPSQQPPVASATSVPSPTSGSLTLSESSWTWGDIAMSEGFAIREVTFENTSSEPVTITSMVTSCMCTTVSLIRANGSMIGPKGMPGHGGGSNTTRETIEPGESGTLRIVFDPNAHGPSAVGPIRRSVTLTTSSATQPEIEFTFSGNVVK